MKEKENYQQSGFNPEYPVEILKWKWNPAGNIPEWVSDNFQISSISEDGKKNLKISPRTNGDIELTTVFGGSVILPRGQGIIIWDKGNVFKGLTEKQFNFLYENKK